MPMDAEKIEERARKEVEKIFCFQPNMNKRGWIYIVRYGEHDIYKIGCTIGNPKKRVSGLQVGTPVQLSLVHQIDCENVGLCEWVLHRLYKKFLIRGEWFQLPKDKLEMLCRRPRISEKKTQLAAEPLIKAVLEDEKRRIAEEEARYSQQDALYETLYYEGKLEESWAASRY